MKRAVTSLLALLGAVACANPPRKNMAVLPPISQTDLDAAATVARREGPAALGHAGESVLGIKPTFPYIFRLELPGDFRGDVMVLDGHVVQGSKLAHVGRYLALTQFLERRDLPIEGLAMLLALWGGGPPSQFSVIHARGTGPSPDEKPALRFGDDGGATLTVYTSWKAPTAPVPGAAGMGYRPSVWLRATLHVDPRYQLRWVVEQQDEATHAWKPLTG